MLLLAKKTKKIEPAGLFLLHFLKSIALLLLSSSLFAQPTDPVFVLNNPKGHYADVFRFHVTSDRTTAITVSRDKSICFWDIASETLTKKIWFDMGTGEKGKLLDSDFDAKTNLLAVARINSEGQAVVNLMDITTTKIIGTFGGFSKELGTVRFDPNSRYILTASGLNSFREPLKLWALPTKSKEPFFKENPSTIENDHEVSSIIFYDKNSKILTFGNPTFKHTRNSNFSIEFNRNTIPPFNIKKIKHPIKENPQTGVYLNKSNSFLFVSPKGKVQIFDKTGKIKELYQSSITQYSDLFISPSENLAIVRFSNSTSSEALLLNIANREYYRIDFSFDQLCFLNESTVLVTSEGKLQTLKLEDQLDSTSKNFYQHNKKGNSEIAFGANKIVLYDDLGKCFSFSELSLFTNPIISDAFSFRKTSHNDVTVEKKEWHMLLINDKTIRLTPFYSNKNFSFLNSGNLLVSMNHTFSSHFHTTEAKTLLYQPNLKSEYLLPLKEFGGYQFNLTGIAPSPEISSSLFITQDLNGRIDLYDEFSEKRNMSLRLDYSTGHINTNFKNFDLIYPNLKVKVHSDYEGNLTNNDVLYSINDRLFDSDNYGFLGLSRLEFLNPLEAVKLQAKRGEEIITSYEYLNATPVLPPLLSYYEQDNEWLCWTQEGYYASSAGGERLGGWVVNQNVNQIAEYHPLYDFKKEYYKPSLIKLITEEESFDQAMTLYNRTAIVPLSKNAKVTDNLPPSVQWITPMIKDTTYQKNAVILKTNVQSASPVTNAKVLLNGRTIIRWDQIKITNQGESNYQLSFEMELLLLENTINIFVENEHGSTISEERILRSEKLQQGLERYKPNLYLLSIGVSQHSNPNYSLSYADKDALEISSLYRGQKGRLFKDVFDKTLTDKQATRSNILDAFYWLEENATQKDVVLIFIASHGINQKERFYILPYDGDPNRIRITGVDWLDFSDVLGNLPSKVLVFIDACHSGKLGTNLLASRGETDLLEAIRTLATEENGVVIMAASTGKEYSYEKPEWGHGAFTLALLNGLKDGKADLNQDGIVNIREIDYFVAERVKELTHGKQHPTTQKPSVVAEFPLIQIE
ncbi:Uncharacterized protein, contains caspase domain [Reichenbachiella faecimaris]|uniref:Uncharacterized protein, contains caspase domain n=1 Tax=Reichenbachiella faecimaris TaxID=692418 RepID=A0A1W2GHV3_REIFA|nr:caspase family protein [Reichenbachiella faecimaris]SMD36239.1 Uncharacterized protein, contains caspase domain [Reichenbachiella faecimaris]